MQTRTVYAHPASSGAAAVTAICGEYYRNLSLRLVKEHGAHLWKDSRGMRQVWRAWISHPPNWRTDWNRACGTLGASTEDGSTSKIRNRWVEFILYLSSRGVPGNWTASFSTPTTLFYRGGLLCNVRKISVRGGGGRDPDVEIQSDADQSFKARPIFRWGRQLISVISIADLAGGEQAEDDAGPFADPVWKTRWHQLASAFSMLDSFTPSYALWVRRVLREVVPLAPPDGVTMSSSDAAAPGVIRLSLDHDAATIGELLVHESAHQYFHLLEQAGPVINESDSALYWSPFRRADRPIRNILVAYHAFANVALYYRYFESARGANLSAVRAVRQEIEGQLSQLDGPLGDSSGLTEQGRFLWSALNKRLLER